MESSAVGKASFLKFKPGPNVSGSAQGQCKLEKVKAARGKIAVRYGFLLVAAAAVAAAAAGDVASL